jgi:hypothetical protein
MSMATFIMKEKYCNGSESVRIFKFKTAVGYASDSTGHENRGAFADGEKGRIESYNIEKLAGACGNRTVKTSSQGIDL